MSEKRPRDPNQLGKRIVDIATGQRAKEREKDTTARAAGQKGGNARAATLTPEERVEIATRAARARWKKPER